MAGFRGIAWPFGLGFWFNIIMVIGVVFANIAVVAVARGAWALLGPGLVMLSFAGH